MGISGSDNAPLYALSGATRFGATRFGYTSPKLFISIGGEQYATARNVDGVNVQYSSGLRIDEGLHEAPNTAAFTVRGLEPREGTEVIVTLGSINNLERQFFGFVLNRAHIYRGSPANWYAPINAIDYTWFMLRRFASGAWTNASATTIANAIVAQVPGLTSAVPSGLPVLDTFSCTNVMAMAALAQLAKRIGGYCDVDYHKRVKLFIADATVSNPRDLTADHPTLTDISYQSDLSQVVTRAIVIGGGATAAATADVGQTSLPIDGAASWYNEDGGTVQINQQRVSYAGVQAADGSGSLVGPGIGPTTAPVLALADGSGIENGAHTYAVTWLTSAGESLPSPIAIVTTGALVAPTTAPTGVAQAGAGLDDGAHAYEVTFVTSAGETTPGAVSGAVPAGQQTIPIPFPMSSSFTQGAGGALTSSAYYSYAVTWTTATGETASVGFNPIYLSASQSSVRVVFGQAGGLNSWPANITGAKIYRTKVGAPTTPYYLVHTVTGIDVSTQFYPIDFTDTAADSSLGANPPSSSTATTAYNRVALSNIPKGPSNVTSRKLYRRFNVAGTFKLVTTIANNTATTYTDSTANASLGADAPASNTAVTNQVALSSIPLGTSTVTARNLYRTAAGASQLQLLHQIANNTATTYTDSTADASLGVNVPTGDTSGLTATQPQTQFKTTGVTFPTNGAATAATSLAPVFSSASYNFTSSDVGAYIQITAGTNWTTGRYLIVSVAANKATLDRACATTASPTSGTWGVDYSVLGSPLFKFTDLVIGGTNTQFTSAAHPVGPNFVGNSVNVTGGLGFTVQQVIVVSTSGTTATCDKPMGVASSTDGLGILGGQVSTSVQPRATTLLAAGIGWALPTGGWAAIGNGQQFIRYTGISGSTITGIPTSGVGAIMAAISYGSTVTAASALTGIPASGAGSIVYPILQGDPVNLLVQVDDPAAQTTLAALFATTPIASVSATNPAVVETTVAHGFPDGQTAMIIGTVTTPAINGFQSITRIDPTHFSVAVNVSSGQASAGGVCGSDDGVIEDVKQDGTIGESEARARATATLELVSTPLITVRYQTRDPNTHAGRSITVNLGAPMNLTLTLLIQHVTIDNFQPALMPTYTVEASTVRFSFEDLLRSLRRR